MTRATRSRTSKPWLDHQYDGWTTEAIYDELIKKRDEALAANHPLGGFQLPSPWMVNPITGLSDDSDIVESDDPDAQKSIEHTNLNNVLSASHSSAMGGGAGTMPGEIEATIKRFLAPKLPWEQILHNFFNELANQDYSWARPNRRYQDMYLPSLMDDDGGLDHIAYFLDVSGSISDGDIIRFHSEFKYVKEHFQPEKMTMLQFDTRITDEKVFLQEDPFEDTHVIGRGGTCLICVRDWIIEHQPAAVVVFSDLQVEPMQPLPQGLNVPIIWIALNNTGAKVPHGELVHLRE